LNRLRFLTVLLLLGVTISLLYTRGNADLIPSRQPLAQLPEQIAEWAGRDKLIAQESLDVLGPGDFLSRGYTTPAQPYPIDLFIGYFPTQRTGNTIHSPKHCLPGSGWAFESSKYVDIMDTDNKPHRIGEYVIGNGENKDAVLYWYQAHGRSVASEYAAKLYMITDAMQFKRTDGALVRVITPIGRNESQAVAMARAEAFTRQLAPLLPSYIPN